jgi:hypothetical protein
MVSARRNYGGRKLIWINDLVEFLWLRSKSIKLMIINLARLGERYKLSLERSSFFLFSATMGYRFRPKSKSSLQLYNLSNQIDRKIFHNYNKNAFGDNFIVRSPLCLLFSDVQPRGTESEKSFLCVFLLFSIN